MLVRMWNEGTTALLMEVQTSSHYGNQYNVSSEIWELIYRK